MHDFVPNFFIVYDFFVISYLDIIFLILDRSNIQSRFDFDDGETTDTDRSETTIKELHIDSSDDDSQSTQVQMKL